VEEEKFEDPVERTALPASCARFSIHEFESPEAGQSPKAVILLSPVIAYPIPAVVKYKSPGRID
jgi:hypothetical protein